jgi:hypothetical protein
LVGVPRAYRLDGRVTLHLAGTDLVHMDARGLQEVSEPARTDETMRPTRPLATRSSSWRSFRYGTGPMSLVLHAQTPAEDRSAEAVVDRAWLTTSLEPSGRLVHHFRFHVWNWRQRELPLRLPADAQLQAASVDGRCLDRLPPAEKSGGVVQIALPVVGEAVLHRFEIVYVTELPHWLVWAQLDAPAPELPVRSLAFRRTWRLPGGVNPVAIGAFQRLPSSRAEDNLLGWLSRLVPAPADPELPRQKQAVAEALARFRKQARDGDQGQLGPWLETFALDYLRDQPRLVLDSSALRDAGVTATAAVRQPAETPFWESAGLVYVPCRGAPLLTSRERWAGWQAEGNPEGAVPVSIEHAVAEAARAGHDVSGRFRTVNDWLRGGDAEPAAAPMLLSAGLMPQGLDPDATAWEPLAGPEYSGAIVIVRDRIVPSVGLALALVLLMVFGLTSGRLTDRWQRRLLLVWLATAGLTLVWLPAALGGLAFWPLLAGLVVTLMWCVRKGRIAQPVRADGSSVASARVVPATSMVLALIAFVGTPGQAAAPAPLTVYLIPGEADKQAVLAPPELLEQLQALTRRGAAGLRGAMLLGATYEGRADNQTAQIEARFPVHCFNDEPTSLFLPLANVQLLDALLDGAAAHPVAVRLPRDGYTIDIKGKGSHSITVRFAVPLPGTTEDRELRFGIPELPRSRLALDVPAGAGYLMVVEARGTQRVTVDERSTHLEADLGAVGSIRVRWRRDGQQPRAAGVSVTEAYYWDLHASSARLLAVLDYAVTKGWLTHLQLELPKELDVLSAEVHAGPGSTAVPQLREWAIRTDGGPRRLVLEFLGPVAGNVAVTLEMMPRQPFGKVALLPFPNPLDVESKRGFLAYRADGVEAVYQDSRGITGINRDKLADTFATEFGQVWKAARQQELPQPTMAYSRAKGGSLQLGLKPPQSQVRGQQEAIWRIEPRQASVRATARLTAPDGGLALVEWDVPGGISVTEVSGPLVRSWSRIGGRVQVWLQRPTAEATLTLTGWMPRLPKEATRFDLPCLRLAAVRSQASTVRVIAGDGLALGTGKVQNLTPRPDLVVPKREWGYQADQENYSGTFPVSPAATDADFSLLTFAEVRNRQLTFTSTLDCQVRQGELRNLTVTLRNWEGGDVQIDAPDVARKREQRLGGGGRSWVLELQPGVTRRYQLALTGSVPFGSNPEVLMPDVRVESPGAGSVRLHRWLAVSGPELQAEGAAGLVPLVAGSDELQAWPRDAERLRRAGGLAWKISSDDWRLGLRSRVEAFRPAAVQVYLTEHAAAVADGRRWTHKATYWLYHEAGADLSVLLPSGASVLSVTVDGLSVPPLQPGAERLWLPLAGGAGARVVRLSWAFPEGQEPLTAPFLTGPRLEGVAEAPVFWTLHVPAGYWVSRSSASQSGRVAEAGGAAALNLARAAVQLRVATRLIERARDENEPAPAAQLRSVRQRFERLCRQAEYELAAPGTSEPGTGPNGQPLSAWLQELREQFRALAAANPVELGKTEPVDRSKSAVPGELPSAGLAGSFPFALAPFERGRPAYWHAASSQSVPSVQLSASTGRENREALTRSALLLAFLLAAWIVSHFFRSAGIPEQIALFGCVGAVLFGPLLGKVFVLVVAAGLIIRLIILIKWIRAVWQRPPAVEAVKPN